MTIVRIENPTVFVGMNIDKVFSQITDQGYTPLHTKADKITKEFVKDYDPLRVLIESEKDIVTAAKIG